MNTNDFLMNKFKIPNGVFKAPFIGDVNLTRNSIAEAVGDLGFRNGVEVGVRKGHFSKVILESAKKLNLTLVDPWMAYDNNSNNRAQKYYESALNRLNQYKDRVTFKRMFSREAADDFNDCSLDFVYIDAMHDFNNVMMDILMWAPNVRKGGIISGHDFWHHENFGVIEAVSAYTKCNNINKWFITAEKIPSWFFVKE